MRSNNKINRSFLSNVGIPFFLSFNCFNWTKTLGFFLVKHTVGEVRVKFELSLINLKGKRDLVKKFDTILQKDDDSDSGSLNFIEEKELTDLGFINKDTILAKVYVEVLES